jgi:hypothetical protein
MPEMKRDRRKALRTRKEVIFGEPSAPFCELLLCQFERM